MKLCSDKCRNLFYLYIKLQYEICEHNKNKLEKKYEKEYDQCRKCLIKKF